MNALVDLVNYKIKSVCEQHSDCIFVDSNPNIDLLGGHFCEPGVDETYDSRNGGKGRNRCATVPRTKARTSQRARETDFSGTREETWFYEWSESPSRSRAPQWSEKQNRNCPLTLN